MNGYIFYRGQCPEPGTDGKGVTGGSVTVQAATDDWGVIVAPENLKMDMWTIGKKRAAML